MFKCPACNGSRIVLVTHNVDGSLCDLPATDTCPTCNGTGETADDLTTPDETPAEAIARVTAEYKAREGVACICGPDHDCRATGCDDACPSCT